jgi:hypothetical protein
VRSVKKAKAGVASGAQNPAEKKSLLNGSSLSSLAGAVPSAKLQVEIRLPASSIAEALETIHRLGRTGNLTVNFMNGRAMDLKWLSSRETTPPEV